MSSLEVPDGFVDRKGKQCRYGAIDDLKHMQLCLTTPVYDTTDYEIRHKNVGSQGLNSSSSSALSGLSSGEPPHSQ